MGDFEHFASKTLFSITLTNEKGEKLGKITVSQGIERYESYDHLKKHEMGSASNRQILEKPTGSYTFGVIKWTSPIDNKPLPSQVDQITADLQTHNGLKKGETIIKLADKGFKESFTQEMNLKYKYKTIFEDNPKSPF